MDEIERGGQGSAAHWTLIADTLRMLPQRRQHPVCHFTGIDAIMLRQFVAVIGFSLAVCFFLCVCLCSMSLPTQQHSHSATDTLHLPITHQDYANHIDASVTNKFPSPVLITRR